MSRTNQDIITRADLTLDELKANGGYMTQPQSNTFRRMLIDEPTLLRDMRSVSMASDTMKLNAIGFKTRVLRRAVSQTPLTVAQRAKPTTENIEIRAHEVIAEVRIPYDVIEANIEGGDIGRRTDSSLGGASGGIKDTIMTLLAARVALDLEELGLRGDTANATDDFLAMTDGVLKRIGTNTADAGGPATKEAFNDAMLALPTRYARNLGPLRFYMSRNNVLGYNTSLTGRETALGDSRITGSAPLLAYGVPVETVALMPQDTGVLVDPSNLIFGIHRDVHLETDKDITSREIIIVVTMKVGFTVEDEEAAVKITGLAA